MIGTLHAGPASMSGHSGVPHPLVVAVVPHQGGVGVRLQASGEGLARLERSPVLPALAPRSRVIKAGAD